MSHWLQGQPAGCGTSAGRTDPTLLPFSARPMKVLSCCWPCQGTGQLTPWRGDLWLHWCSVAQWLGASGRGLLGQKGSNISSRQEEGSWGSAPVSQGLSPGDLEEHHQSHSIRCRASQPQAASTRYEILKFSPKTSSSGPSTHPKPPLPSPRVLAMAGSLSTGLSIA